jgi:hypothetical protein
MLMQRHAALASLQRAIRKRAFSLTLTHLLVCFLLTATVINLPSEPVASARETTAIGRHVRYLPALYRAGAAAPSVSIAGVNDGQTVSGSITFQALVSGSTAVREVKFYINANNVWTEQSTPYYLGGRVNGYNTAQLANGAYSFKAVATTSSGQSSSAQIRLTVRNGSSAPTPTPAPTANPGPNPSPTANPGPNPSPTAAPPTATGGRSVQLGFYYNEPSDGTSAATIASRVGFVISSNTRWRDQLRAAGYRGTLVRYFLSNEVEGPGPYKNGSASCNSSYDPLGNQAAYNQGDFCRYIHPNEDWFLHNGRGERLISTWYDNRPTYHMNPGNAGWRAFARSRFAPEISGFDGLYLDNVELNLYKLHHQIDNSDGVVKEYATDEAFRNAMVGYLAQMNSLPGVVWGNLVNDDRKGSQWDLYMTQLDGALQEAWGNGYVTPSPQEWDANMRQTEKVLAQGKGVMMGGHGNKSETTVQQFTTASYLLVTNGQQAYFRFSRSAYYRQWWYFSNYDVRLGAPKGPRYQSGSLWRRDFACGYVTVDPAARIGKIVQTCN